MRRSALAVLVLVAGAGWLALPAPAAAPPGAARLPAGDVPLPLAYVLRRRNL